MGNNAQIPPPTLLPITSSVVENPDGTVSVFNGQPLVPVILTKTSCEALDPSYTFDINTQTCRWAPIACSVAKPIKVILNSNGNDGSLFYTNSNDNCSLSIDFDYLFKIKCETLFGILISASTQSPVSIQLQQQITSLQLQISQQTALCAGYSGRIGNITSQISNTPYTISCVNMPSSSNRTVGDSISTENRVFTSGDTYSGFSHSGFGLTPVPFSYGYFRNVYSDVLPVYTTYSLTEPAGLEAWSNILGPVNYQKFLEGDITSYSCSDVETIISLNEDIVNNNLLSRDSQPILITVGDVAVGSRNSLANQLDTVIANRLTCQQTLNQLIASLAALTTLFNSNVVSSCATPLQVLELLDVSVTLDVVDSNNNLQTISEFTIFPQIGLGNLYNYLVSNTNSGFYVCDGSADCSPIELLPNSARPIAGSCASIVNNIINDLYIESNLSGITNGQTTFTNTLPTDALASDWLHFNTVISDPYIINQIANKKIKLTFKVNHMCSDLCILVDDIILDKVCVETENTSMFVTQSPGFELDRVVDNKKSWLDTTTPVTRDFSISNNSGTNNIRQTDYDVNDERLVINSKEIDLNINIASAIENDVWCFIKDNPSILTGNTCITCGSSFNILPTNSSGFYSNNVSLLNSEISGTNSFSISFWDIVGGFASNSFSYGRNQQFLITRGAQGVGANISIRIFGTSVNSTTWTTTNYVPYTLWSHVVITYDASQPVADRVHIYLNGVDETLIITTQNAGLITTINSAPTLAFRIHRTTSPNIGYTATYDLQLNRLMFWNTNLSNSEAIKLYNSGAGINETINQCGYNSAANLLLWYCPTTASYDTTWRWSSAAGSLTSTSLSSSGISNRLDGSYPPLYI